MERRRRVTSPRWGSAALLLLVAAALASADTIDLKDGRHFEGKIVALSDERVVIDAKVGDTRAKLGFARSEIAKMVEQEVDPGFFDSPRADARASDPKKFGEDATLYLEAPVIGEVGKNLFAAALAPVLAYASAHDIRHLVFVVDSGGGDPDEGVAFYRLLRKYRDKIEFHAIIRQCRGAALGLALWCDTVHVLPGGVVSGLETLPKLAASDGAEDEQILRAQIANRVVTETGRTGLAARITRGLLDPSEALVVWRDGEGSVQFGPVPPADVAKDKLILNVPAGQFVELTSDHFVALGVRPFQGESKELGRFLGVKGWTCESDYGEKTMTRVSAEKQKKLAATEKAHETKIEKNVARRQETHDYFESSLKQAAEWDPRKGEYVKYTQTGWGWEASAVEWTEESQKRWKSRTDGAIHYLKEALKALKSLKKLDAEALKLGLQPTFPPGEIDVIFQDLESKLLALATERGRKGD